jgi:outer membrane protein TolC
VVDLRGQIESEICDSYVDLQAAASQMELAKSNQQLAREMGNADQKLDDYLKVQ